MGQVLTEVPGRNGRTYQIILGDDGVTYCSCPAWKFRRDCKHLRAYLSINAQSFEESIQDDPLSTAILDAVQLLKER